jgi:hypothetical protein
MKLFLLYGYIHKVFSYTQHSSMQHPVSHGEHPIKIPILPVCEPACLHWGLGRDSPLAWPPWSPDTAPLNFFLWGYVKDMVYAIKCTRVEDLKVLILKTNYQQRHAGSHIKTAGILTECSPCNRGCPQWTNCGECMKNTLCMYPSNKINFTFFLAIYSF